MFQLFFTLLDADVQTYCSCMKQGEGEQERPQRMEEKEEMQHFQEAWRNLTYRRREIQVIGLPQSERGVDLRAHKRQETWGEESIKILLAISRIRVATGLTKYLD